MSAACTRGGLLRALAGAGAAVAGGSLIAGRSGGTDSLAAPSAADDVKLLNFFLLLERVQRGLLRAAARAGG